MGSADAAQGQSILNSQVWGWVFFPIFLIPPLRPPFLLEAVFACGFFPVLFFLFPFFIYPPLMGSYETLCISGCSYLQLMCVVHFCHQMGKKRDRLRLLQQSA